MGRRKGIEYPVEELKKMFTYDPETGIIRWTDDPTSKYCTNRKRGKEAGHLKKVKNREYTRREIKFPDGKNYLAHRVIWAWMTGKWPVNMIDHFDQNPLNNKWDNLREVDNLINQQNATMRKDNSTGVTGVCLTKNNKYHVRINKDGKQVTVGYFETLEEAIDARKEAEKKYGYSENHGRVKTW